MAEVVARASWESFRAGVTAMKWGATAVWDKWGARVPRTAMRVNVNNLACHDVHDLAPLHFCPVTDSPSSRLSRDESRDSKTASRPLNDDRVSSSGATEEGRYATTFRRGAGMQHRRGDGGAAHGGQHVYTLHPSFRTTSICSSSLTRLPPHVRVPGTPKYVFFYKKGIYQLLLVGPNSLLLPRASITMEFAPMLTESQEAPEAAAMNSSSKTSLHYMRHGKEFLVGVQGSREDVENIKTRIAHFLRTELHLEVGLSSHVHIQSGSVVFLGTRIAGLLENKTRRRFSKEIEKRRRSKIRAQRMVEVRTAAWHNELKDLAVQSWAFGLKKTKAQLQSWEAAKQAMYKKSQEVGRSFVLEQIERGQTKEAVQRLLDKEEEIFFNAPSTGLPEPILRAHHRLTRLLQRYLEDETTFEKKAKAMEKLQPRTQSAPADNEHVIPLQLLAPMEIVTAKLRKKGILQPTKALPTVLTSMISSSDEAIVSYFSALGTCLLSYYRCCDNFQKIRRLVDHQVRWSALFTLGSKHGCSARKIIREFSRGPRILNRKGRVIVEFPSSPDILRMGKKFLVHVQRSSLDDILRSRRLQLLPGEEKQGPRRVRLRDH